MYSKSMEVTYSSVDSNGNLRIANLIEYMQDVCVSHSHNLYLNKKNEGSTNFDWFNNAWLLLEWQIEIKRIPKLYDNIEIITIPYDFKSFFGYRNFCVNDENGETIILADTLWAFMDINTQKPIRITPENEFPARGTQIYNGFDKKKFWKNINKTGEIMLCEEVINMNHLDTNSHVNNAHYIKMAEGYFDGFKSASKIKVFYQKSVYFGDKVSVWVVKDDDGDIITIRNSENEDCVYIKLYKTESSNE